MIFVGIIIPPEILFNKLKKVVEPFRLLLRERITVKALLSAGDFKVSRGGRVSECVAGNGHFRADVLRIKFDAVCCSVGMQVGQSEADIIVVCLKNGFAPVVFVEEQSF